MDKSKYVKSGISLIALVSISIGGTIYYKNATNTEIEKPVNVEKKSDNKNSTNVKTEKDNNNKVEKQSDEKKEEDKKVAEKSLKNVISKVVEKRKNIFNTNSVFESYLKRSNKNKGKIENSVAEKEPENNSNVISTEENDNSNTNSEKEEIKPDDKNTEEKENPKVKIVKSLNMYLMNGDSELEKNSDTYIFDLSTYKKLNVKMIIEGDNLESSDRNVRYEVVGNTSEGTKVEGDVLTIGEDEMSESLTLKAISEFDNTKISSVKINLKHIEFNVNFISDLVDFNKNYVVKKGRSIELVESDFDLLKKEGYEFKGWKLGEEENLKSLEEIKALKVTDNMKFVAVFEKLPAVLNNFEIVVKDFDENTKNVEKTEKEYLLDLTVNNRAKLEVNIEGENLENSENSKNVKYEIVGNTSEGTKVEGDVLTIGEDEMSESLTLKAISEFDNTKTSSAKINLKYIEFNVNFISDLVDFNKNYVVKKGRSIELVESDFDLLKKEGYEFKGWKLGEEENLKSLEEIKALKVTDNMKFVAVFEKLPAVLNNFEIVVKDFDENTKNVEKTEKEYLLDLTVNNRAKLEVNIEGENLENSENGKDVTYAVSGNSSTNTNIENGILTIGEDETANSITVIATSVFDSTKTSSAVINLKYGEVTVEFVADLGNGTEFSKLYTVKKGETLEKYIGSNDFNVVEREGYEFVGWALENENAESIEAIKLNKFTQDIKYKAVFRQLQPIIDLFELSMISAVDGEESVTFDDEDGTYSLDLELAQSAKLNLNIEGRNLENAVNSREVIYTIADKTSTKTGIEGNTLVIGDDEQGELLTITATSKIDSSKTATVKVWLTRVEEAPETEEPTTQPKKKVVLKEKQPSFSFGNDDNAKITIDENEHDTVQWYEFLYNHKANPDKVIVKRTGERVEYLNTLYDSRKGFKVSDYGNFEYEIAINKAMLGEKITIEIDGFEKVNLIVSQNGRGYYLKVDENANVAGPVDSGNPKPEVPETTNPENPVKPGENPNVPGTETPGTNEPKKPEEKPGEQPKEPGTETPKPPVDDNGVTVPTPPAIQPEKLKTVKVEYSYHSQENGIKFKLTDKDTKEWIDKLKSDEFKDIKVTVNGIDILHTNNLDEGKKYKKEKKQFLYIGKESTKGIVKVYWLKEGDRVLIQVKGFEDVILEAVYDEYDYGEYYILQLVKK